MESRYLLLIAIAVLSEVTVIVTFVRMAESFKNFEKNSTETKQASSFFNHILRSENTFKKFLSSTIKSIF